MLLLGCIFIKMEPGGCPFFSKKKSSWSKVNPINVGAKSILQVGQPPEATWELEQWLFQANT
jgi:hypothetical protein